MIRRELQKSFYKNATIMAYADGNVCASEQKWMQTLIEAAEISPEDAALWDTEIQGGSIDWCPVPGGDRQEAEQVMRLAVGIVAADGKLDPRERQAVIQLGKTLGFDFDQVQAIFKQAWGQNTLKDIFYSPAPPEPTSDVVAVTDHFEGIDAFIESHKNLTFDRRSAKDFCRRPGEPCAVVFHIASERPLSVTLVSKLHEALPATELVAVVERSQAAQVSYMLEGGASRCIIEPAYPDELMGVLQRT